MLTEEEYLQSTQTPQVEVTNLDEISAALHNIFLKIGKQIKITDPVINIPKTEINFPDEFRINNLSEIKPYFDTLAASLVRAISKIPEPRINVQPASVNIPEIDLQPFIKAITKSLDLNLNKVRTNGKTRPLAVRLSDGQEFIDKITAAIERQEIAFAGFNENMRLKDSQGNSINPATREDIQALTIAVQNLSLGGSGALLSISSFINNKNSVENGTSVTSTILTWTLNKAVTSQSFNQSIGDIDSALRIYTDTSTYTTNRTYILTISDGITTVVSSSSVSFLNKRHWGVSSNTTLNDAQIIALDKELSSTRVKSFTLTPAAQYLYYCFPASFGTPTIVVNGLPVTNWVLSTQNHINASGATVSYSVWRSSNLLTGTYIIAIS